MGALTAFTHLDADGHAYMVDVTGKAITHRVAVATAFVRASATVVQAIREQAIAKGDVLATARIAGIQAAKQTALLIPLCHSLPLDAVAVELVVHDEGVHIRAQVSCTGRTGVEMEALTAASVAALTVYDMCKALDHGITIEQVCLAEKMGGRSGHWQRATSSGVSMSAKAAPALAAKGTSVARSRVHKRTTP